MLEGSGGRGKNSLLIIITDLAHLINQLVYLKSKLLYHLQSILAKKTYFLNLNVIKSLELTTGLQERQEMEEPVNDTRSIPSVNSRV